MVSSEDYRESLVKNLITIRDSLKEYHQLFQSEIEIQRPIHDRLCVLAKRFCLLDREEPTKHILPSDISPEDEIKAEYFEKFLLIRKSNAKLIQFHMMVANNFKELRQFLDEMGPDNLVLLDKANILQLPFSSCIEILDDLIKYHIKLVSNVHFYTLCMQPERLQYVERYKKLLKPNVDFNEYFSQSMAKLHVLKKTK
ncbi:uncharacterized protein LOC129912196 [Episyrphus balteatus]|uniref:uncharacterized protein LOC129912196 n=1 Tax=Episyrphus balteatus TaxID=286459 RepID=UPI0024859B75|nr:uncharacterized protein LOC129912196 [Episyrphus balteatus]